MARKKRSSAPVPRPAHNLFVYAPSIAVPGPPSLLLAERRPAPVSNRLWRPARTRIETGEFVIAAIKALGVDVPASSRLMRMHRAYTNAIGSIRPGHADFETVLEAERDMQQLEYIFEQDHARTRHPGLLKLLPKLINDSVLPQARGDSTGRDAQLELFVAAICQAAGFIPVDYPEPDVTCVVDGVSLAIAAKRIKSEDQTEKRVAKAAKQIQKSGMPGVIALDTTIARNPKNERFTVPMPDDQFGRLYRKEIDPFFRRHAEQMRDSAHGRGVLGLIVHDHRVRLGANRLWSLESMTVWYCTAEDEASRRLFGLFTSRYSCAIPNMRRL
jgi:hypothetical protein